MSILNLFRSAVVAATFASAKAQNFMSPGTPSALHLKTEYLDSGNDGGVGNYGDYFVFLQKFPLEGAEIFYHTEVLVCPQSEFSAEDHGHISEKISSMTDFAELDEAWWKSQTANCVELGYGGAMCHHECCSVGKENMELNKHQAVISNADVSKKSLYIYGTGSFDGEMAYHNTCDEKCWSKWSGFDYNILNNNCNTFTSTVLSCVYGLSQKKPHLGVSDMVTVDCTCPSGSSEKMN